MNNNELKQAITEDMKTLKNLDLDIIPAREYYTSLFKLFISWVWKLGLVAFVAILYASVVNPNHHGIAKESILSLVTNSAIIAFVMAVGGVILLGSAIMKYYLINYHLKNRLKTGHLLVNKLRQFAWIFFSIFTFFCLLFAIYSDSADIFFMLVFAFIISALITYMAVSMEINRVGVSTIFTAVSQFFNKDKSI